LLGDASPLPELCRTLFGEPSGGDEGVSIFRLDETDLDALSSDR